MLQALEEFAVEASIAKVLGSEVLDYILDENVQIHGGNGFVRDYPAEGHYRDARVNRIFEGTNEINRLLIPGMLMKKALKGELALIPAAMKLQDEIMSPSMTLPDDADVPLVDQARAVGAFKKVVLLIAGSAMQRYGEKLQDEQEVLSYIADIVIDTYAAESAVLRAQASANGNDAARAACRRGERLRARGVRTHRAGRPLVPGGDERWGRAAHPARGAAPRCSRSHRSTRSRCGGVLPMRPTARGGYPLYMA